MTSISKRGALFLDRDGTIIVDSGYLCDPAAIVLLPGAREALQEAARHYHLYLFTNQSGIGRGFYTLAAAEAVNRRLIELLQLPPPAFRGICIAPEHPDQAPIYRKPSPRFILEMITRDNLDPATCWMIGDRLSDLQAGHCAKINSLLIENSAHLDSRTLEFCANHKIPRCASLTAALPYILPPQVPGLAGG